MSPMKFSSCSRTASASGEANAWATAATDGNHSYAIPS